MLSFKLIYQNFNLLSYPLRLNNNLGQSVIKLSRRAKRVQYILRLNLPKLRLKCPARFHSEPLLSYALTPQPIPSLINLLLDEGVSAQTILLSLTPVAFVTPVVGPFENAEAFF
jgi:hypothetical protein